jgi:hypothetical protein
VVFVDSNADAALTSCAITNAAAKSNSGDVYGGVVALINSNANATLISCTITGAAAMSNSRDALGGVICLYTYAYATFFDCIIASTVARSSSGDAGGGVISLASNANAALTRCTITRISATSLSSAAYGGMIHLIRSSIVLTDCTITDATATGDLDANGGLIYLYDADATFTRVTVTNAAAMSNLGYAYGGCLSIPTASSATLTATMLQRCRAHSSQARGEGGSAFVDGGSIMQLSNGPLLVGSEASTDGNTLMINSATALYTLPTPSGRWVAGSICLVNRQPRARSQDSVLLDAECGATEGACERVTQDVDASVGGIACQPTRPFQQCDWFSFPQLVGQIVEFLPRGALNVDYPYSCNTGILGSTNPAFQSTALCAGLTPAGTYQPPHLNGTLALDSAEATVHWAPRGLTRAPPEHRQAC